MCVIGFINLEYYTLMEKKRAIIMMIARYRADAVALEKREKDLLQQIEFIENLIPTVSISYMSRAMQAKKQMHPQAEVDEARERLEHLKQSLQELQQSVHMVRDEANIMNKRIIELEAMLIDQYPGVSALEGLNLFRLTFDITNEDKGNKKEKKREEKTQETNQINNDTKPKPVTPPSKADPIPKKEREDAKIENVKTTKSHMPHGSATSDTNTPDTDIHLGSVKTNSVILQFNENRIPVKKNNAIAKPAVHRESPATSRGSLRHDNASPKPDVNRGSLRSSSSIPKPVLPRTSVKTDAVPKPHVHRDKADDTNIPKRDGKRSSIKSDVPSYKPDEKRASVKSDISNQKTNRTSVKSDTYRSSVKSDIFTPKSNVNRSSVKSDNSISKPDTKQGSLKTHISPQKPSVNQSSVKSDSFTSKPSSLKSDSSVPNADIPRVSPKTDLGALKSLPAENIRNNVNDSFKPESSDTEDQYSDQIGEAIPEYGTANLDSETLRSEESSTLSDIPLDEERKDIKNNEGVREKKVIFEDIDKSEVNYIQYPKMTRHKAPKYELIEDNSLKHKDPDILRISYGLEDELGSDDEQDSETDEEEEQRRSFEELLQDESTDWKQVSERLSVKVDKLSASLARAAVKLKEYEDYVKSLEEKYAKLEREILEKDYLLELKEEKVKRARKIITPCIIYEMGEGEGLTPPYMQLAHYRFALKLPEYQNDRDLKEKLMNGIKQGNMAPYYKEVCADLGWDFDSKLYDEMCAANVKRLEELEKEHENNVMDEEDQSQLCGVWQSKLDYLCSIGDKENATALANSKVDDKTVPKSHRIDAVFALFRISFFHGCNIKGMSTAIEKATELIEGISGGDWSARNKLKAYEGVWSLAIRDFTRAAHLFVDVVPTFESYELADFGTIIRYTVQSCMIALPRCDLRKKLMLHGVMAQALHSQYQDLREYFVSLYEGRYSDFLSCLACIEVQMKRDPLLNPHYRYYVQEMRLRAYKQILQAYRSLSLDYMAQSFGVTSEFIEREVARFAAAGRLQCKIDSVAGTVITSAHLDDSVRSKEAPEASLDRNILYQTTVKRGDILLNRLKKLARVMDF